MLVDVCFQIFKITELLLAFFNEFKNLLFGALHILLHPQAVSLALLSNVHEPNNLLLVFVELLLFLLEDSFVHQHSLSIVVDFYELLLELQYFVFYFQVILKQPIAQIHLNILSLSMLQVLNPPINSILDIHGVHNPFFGRLNEFLKMLSLLVDETKGPELHIFSEFVHLVLHLFHQPLLHEVNTLGHFGHQGLLVHFLILLDLFLDVFYLFG